MTISQLDQIHLVQEDEFLPSIGAWITIGSMFLVIVFSVAAALSAVLKFNVTVKAPATIRPYGELRLVQSSIEGTVTQIAAQENQVVKKGETIARLDDSQIQTRISQLQGDLQWGTLQLVQVEAQARALERQIVAEKNLMSRAIAAANANLASSQRHYQELKITTQADVEEAEAGLNLAEEELFRYRQLEEAGAIATLQVRTKEAALQAASAKVKRLKVALNPINSEVTRAAELIAQEQAKGTVTLANLHQQREQLLQNQIEVRNQLHRYEKEREQLNIELVGTVIRAPINGTVLHLNLRNPGQVTQPGQAIAQIAPFNAPLLIKARVSAQDINQVEIGQTAQMRVSACPYTDYGTLKGTVRTIAPDTSQSESREPTTAASALPAFYEITIQPHSLFVGNEKHWCRLQFGMEGRADVIARRETILTFVLKKARLLTNL